MRETDHRDARHRLTLASVRPAAETSPIRGRSLAQSPVGVAGNLAGTRDRSIQHDACGLPRRTRDGFCVESFM